MVQRPALVPGLIGAALMLAAIMELPYGFYTFLRIATAVIGVVLMVLASRAEIFWVIVPLAGVVILWNPVIPVGLIRDAWLPLNLIGGAVFAVAALVIGPAKIAAHPTADPPPQP